MKKFGKKKFSIMISVNFLNSGTELFLGKFIELRNDDGHFNFEFKKIDLGGPCGIIDND